MLQLSSRTWLLVCAACLLAGGLLGGAWTYQRYCEIAERTADALSDQDLLWWQERLPVLHCAGWLNGNAPDDYTLAGKVVVIDVWEDWCDPCLRFAPVLDRIYQKYQGRVMFLGLTMSGKEAAQAWIDRFKIAWPCGYGMSADTMQALGGAGPFTFVIGRDGRVFWSDERARLRHREQRLSRRLEQEIELALAADD